LGADNLILDDMAYISLGWVQDALAVLSTT
jgi:hypothetical protein